MSLPAKYPPHVTPASWNAMVDRVNGYTPSGVFVSPLSYTISKSGADTYATDAFQTVYGGATDEGSVDGAVEEDVIDACVADLIAAGGGEINFKKAEYELDHYINLTGLVDATLHGENGTIIKCSDVYSISGPGMIGCGVFQKLEPDDYTLAPAQGRVHIDGFTFNLNSKDTVAVHYHRSKNSSVSNCHITGQSSATYAGIAVSGHNFTCVNNVIDGCYDGIYVDITYGGLIANNRIINTTNDAIKLDVDIAMQVEDNSITTAVNGLYDIQSKASNFKSNVINDCTNGVFLVDTTKANVEGNYILDTTQYGVSMRGDTLGILGTDIEKNYILNCDDTGIYFYPLNGIAINYTNIKNNYINNCTNYGIYAELGLGGTVSGINLEKNLYAANGSNYSLGSTDFTEDMWNEFKDFPLSSEPATAWEGRLYYDGTAHVFKYYTGAAWKTIDIVP